MIVVADNEFTSEDNEFRIGEVEYEMVELLRRLNINRPVALTLACLSKGEEISSQRIEMVSGLRQPEVSIAMRYLRENDWVDMREEKKNQGKGRPVKLYKLTVRMETIINSIEEDVMAESKAVLQNIERLKNLS
jgi:predicted transcriptional regulator